MKIINIAFRPPVLPIDCISLNFVVCAKGRNIYIGYVLRQIASKIRLSRNKIFDVTVDCLNFSNEERAILRPEENLRTSLIPYGEISHTFKNRSEIYFILV